MDYITQTSATDIFKACETAQAKAVLPQEALFGGIMEISWRYITGMSKMLGGFKYQNQGHDDMMVSWDLSINYGWLVISQ